MLKPDNLWGETFKELPSLHRNGSVHARAQQFPLSVLLKRTGHLGLRIQLLFRTTN